MSDSAPGRCSSQEKETSYLSSVLGRQSCSPPLGLQYWWQRFKKRAHPKPGTPLSWQLGRKQKISKVKLVRTQGKRQQHPPPSYSSQMGKPASHHRITKRNRPESRPNGNSEIHAVRAGKERDRQKRKGAARRREARTRTKTRRTAERTRRRTKPPRRRTKPPRKRREMKRKTGTRRTAKRRTKPPRKRRKTLLRRRTRQLL